MSRVALVAGVFLLGGVFMLNPTLALAQDADVIQGQIDKLKREIETLRKELTTTTTQKQTLQSAIKALDLQIQSLQKSISLTSTQIGQKDKEIVKIGSTILTTAQKISLSEDGVAATLRELNALDDKGLATAMLGGGTLSDFFDEAVALGTVRNDLSTKIEELNALKNNLATSKNQAEAKRKELATLKTQLSNQRQGVATTKSSQAELLKETQNKEAQYQALIAQKQAEQKSFEAALIKSAQGLAAADTSGVPKAAKGILRWPLESVLITQAFGDTEFARTGAYNGKGHPGIDLRAPVGTAVMAALGGVVQEINQGTVKLCGYGKWVLVRHDNGLTTLYAHLSSISVSKGQRVLTGQTVGFAGDTGFAYGSHLHFSVYASSGVSLGSYTCNSGYSVYTPVAPFNAYLNPVLYLP